MGKIPRTRAWVRVNSVKAYGYLKTNEGNVPKEGLPMFNAAANEVESVMRAFADDEITSAELVDMGAHMLIAVNEARKFVI
ncbi:MAG: hypothetical protein SA339_05750 [Methanomassiliicoccus sp.]|nr:hypothetical protein [Methanomassiliicoccus sp.]